MQKDSLESDRNKAEVTVIYLTPEEREDARKVAKEVWIEGMRLSESEG